MTNRSAAVVQQRKAKDRIDYFPTPPWATVALCEWLKQEKYPINKQSVWEPAAGGGHMGDVLKDYFERVKMSDLINHESRMDIAEVDFLMALDENREYKRPPDWIITNPPFSMADSFAERALQYGGNVALLCQIAFLGGKKRYDALFRECPPTDVLAFVRRVGMVKGKIDPKAPGLPLAWFVWGTFKGEKHTRLHWVGA